MTDERACVLRGLGVDRCPTNHFRMDHARVTPAEERESDDLAFVADG